MVSESCKWCPPSCHQRHQKDLRSWFVWSLKQKSKNKNFKEIWKSSKSRNPSGFIWSKPRCFSLSHVDWWSDDVACETADRPRWRSCALPNAWSIGSCPRWWMSFAKASSETSKCLKKTWFGGQITGYYFKDPLYCIECSCLTTPSSCKSSCAATCFQLMPPAKE